MMSERSLSQAESLEPCNNGSFCPEWDGEAKGLISDVVSFDLNNHTDNYVEPGFYWERLEEGDQLDLYYST